MEILAPVGSMEILEAAIQGGADAIYLGGKKFNARNSSTNFTIEEIKEICERMHLLGKRVYVTCNTILFEKELEECISFTDELYYAGVDAVIIQDLGLLKRIYQRYQNMDIHVSTQMSICTVKQIKLLEKYHVKRVVLARETSLEQIKEIRKNTDMEIEVFVHGALCVSYSGQCLMSSVIGKRSGNRGRCAQPCRMKYSLYENEKKFSEETYLLSSKDLCTIEQMEDFLPYVNSLKIEGRLKSLEYVYTAVKNYKNRLLNQKYDVKSLENIFCRKFTPGYILNKTRNEIINSEYKSNYGTYLGKVLDVKKNGIIIELEDDLKPNDTVRFENKYDFGFVVNKFFLKSELIAHAHKKDIIELKCTDHSAFAGDRIFKTSSFDNVKKIKEEIKSAQNFKRIPIDVGIYTKDQQLFIDLSDGKNQVIQFISLKNVETDNPLEEERVSQQLSKFGNTVYEIRDLKTSYQEKIYLKISELNDLRRRAIEALNSSRISKNFYPLNRINQMKPVVKDREKDEIFVIVENEMQYKISEKYTTNIICPINQEGIYAESRIQDDVERDRMLISNIGSLKERKLTLTSPYMNIVNTSAVDFLVENCADLVCLSYELSLEKLVEMKIYENNNLIFPIYGRMDLMYIKSCLIQSNGKEFCNRCTNKSYYLEDRYNYQFPLIIKNCNTRVLNSKVLYLLDKIEELKKNSITKFLLTFTTETEEEMIQVLDNLFKGAKNPVKEKTYGNFIEGIE